MSNVFVNRTLNLKRIKYIGFDMDHTLIRYHTKEFEELAHRIALKKMVDNRGYPASIMDLPFDYNRAIRGLVIDRKNGNLLKINAYGAIRNSYHGTKKIDFATQNKLYKSTYIDLSDPNYLSVDTAFSIAYTSMYAHMIDWRETTTEPNPPSPDTISRDLLECVDEAHRDGSIKNEVRKNVEKYIKKDPTLVSHLEKYVRHGKKLFILTNSDFQYTKLLLDYAISPYLKDKKNWSELFEYIITFAQKPRFFTDKLRFLRVVGADGTLMNIDEDFTPGVYQGGCATTFTGALKLTGDEILYIGDHIYGDIVRLKKDCNWRTALVVEELEQEIKSNIASQPITDQIAQLMSEKEPLELELLDIRSELDEKKIRPDKDGEEKINGLQKKIATIDKKISALIQEQQAMYNQYWGEIFRAGVEESYFSSQVLRYACVYMAKLTDIMEAPPRQYFRSFRRALPHEVTPTNGNS